MSIPSGTYNRIETIAGGCWASDRDFIRALRSKLTNQAKSRDKREIRRELIASMFQKREKARSLFSYVSRGF